MSFRGGGGRTTAGVCNTVYARMMCGDYNTKETFMVLHRSVQFIMFCMLSRDRSHVLTFTYSQRAY